MTQGDNFILITCFLFCGLVQCFDLFQLSGKIPEFKELWNNIDNGFTILESQIFIKGVDILS